jgi:DNA-binding PadR family transcriptional regulator
MFGFHHRHHGWHRECGPRSGSFRRGPFEFAWSFDDEGRGFGGRHGGGRRRMFDSDDLRLILLALLDEQPRHGYDLIREIEERTGGAYAPSPGVVYPSLTMLDEMGHIDEVKEEGARKRFEISEAGRAHLAEKREEVEILMARLAALGEHRARSERAPVRRAMASLHMALRQAIIDGDDTLAHEIVDILDEATRKIERLER